LRVPIFLAKSNAGAGRGRLFRRGAEPTGILDEGPPRSRDFDSYHVDRLIGDAFDIVAVLGYGERRFHLVGHDWGGSLAWLIADRHPERLASLTMLSRPHPASFARALQMPDGEQACRSRHHQEFRDLAAGPRLLADDAVWVRSRTSSAAACVTVGSFGSSHADQ
jgi:pimeloyl-ACP methyl ester carboxylesterase